MKKWNVVSAVVVALMLISLSAVAQDQAEAEVTGQMPAMGPPEEMKQLEWMVGIWSVDGKMWMDPSVDAPMSFTATAEFEYDLGGAVLEMEYASQMMGTPFLGKSFTTWDRERGEWQDTWMDNLTGRQMMMTGQEADGERVVTGVDFFQGQEYLTKNTSFNITEDSFDWKMEQSTDGGETWFTSMTATYKKQ